MLSEYVDTMFEQFKLNKEQILQTKIIQFNGQYETVKMTVKFDIVPHFYIVDDSLTGTGSGKRIIYFYRIQNVRSDHENFDVQKFKYKLNFVAQFRMKTPYKVSHFSLGCLPDFERENYLKHIDYELMKKYDSKKGLPPSKYLN